MCGEVVLCGDWTNPNINLQGGGEEGRWWSELTSREGRRGTERDAWCDPGLAGLRTNIWWGWEFDYQRFSIQTI